VGAVFRIVFFGTPEFAVPSLRALVASPDRVVGVVCQPDRPAGRGQHLTAPPVKLVALEAGVPVVQPDTVRSSAFLDALRRWSPDLVVVAAYGKILPKTVLEVPPHGCINVHGSLLPKYRGAAPIQWAILRGEEVTGVTIMQMNERMDAGGVLLQRATRIGPDETSGKLLARLAEIGAAALMEAIAHMRAGTLTARSQREEDLTLAPMIKKEDGRIDWTQAAIDIARAVRAFNPWPSAFTSLDGKLLKVHQAQVQGDSPADPRRIRGSVPGSAGTVLSTRDGIAVATGRGTLVLEEIQLEGRRRLSAAEFVRGGAVVVGTVLGSRSAPAPLSDPQDG
jgi:methionyl-tRNA formyltransferase